MTGSPADILICPTCRRPPEAWRLDHESLACTNPACDSTYPRLGGAVPVVLPEKIDEVLRVDIYGDLEPIETLLARAQALEKGGHDWTWAAWSGMHVHSHYSGPHPSAALCDALLPQIEAPVQAAVDLGCGAGRMALEIAHRTGAAVVGLDLNPLLCRWADRAGQCERLDFPRLRTGSQFEMCTAKVAPRPAPGSVRWVCADAVNPPLEAEAFDLVTAVSLVDTVPDPWMVLGQACALVRPGGHLILAQPDTWSPDVTPPRQWLVDDEGGWNGVLAELGMTTLKVIDGIRWEAWRSPRECFGYVLHGRIAAKA